MLLFVSTFTNTQSVADPVPPVQFRIRQLSTAWLDTVPSQSYIAQFLTVAVPPLASITPPVNPVQEIPSTACVTPDSGRINGTDGLLPASMIEG